MSFLELKNVKTATKYIVEPGGKIFGREAKEADVVLADRSVSKRHARVYKKNGKWFLEDLGSSNGTFVDGERIRSPITLSAGDVFQVSAFTFEVLRIADGPAPPPSGDEEPHAHTTATMAKADASNPSRTSRAPKHDPDPANDDDSFAPDATEPPAPVDDLPASDGGGEDLSSTERVKKGRHDAPVKAKAAAAKEAARAPREVEPASDEGGEAAAGDPKSVGYYLAAMPRAIGYYVVNVPLLGLNPLGTVRKSIEKQPLHAMRWPELIAYALPANLFAAAVGFLCTVIVQLVSGTLSIGSIIPIVPVIVAVGGSVAGGLLCHPVLSWVIGKLKGTSDEKSRTNYYVLTLAGVALTAVPSGLAMLLSLVPLPFIGVLPVVLSLVSTLIMTLIAFRWFTAFNVVKWFRYVLLGLGALACVAAFLNLVKVVGASISALGSSTPAASAPAVPAAEENEKDDEEKKTDDKEEKEERKDGKEEEKKDDKKDAKAAPVEKKDPPKAEKAEAKAPGEDKGKKAAKPDEDKPAANAARAGNYREYAAQRDAVEKAIADNPLLLKTTPGVLALYERLHRMTAEIRRKEPPPAGKKKKAPPPEMPAAVRERLKDIEVFEKTAPIVEQLHKKLGL